jgi:PKD repeat protein
MKLKSLFLKSFALFLIWANSVGAQVANGGFGVSASNGCSGATSWTIGTPDMQLTNCCNSSGNWWIDLTGCGWGNAHWIMQDVPTTIGQTYIVGFDLGCWNGQCYTSAGANLYIDGNLKGTFDHVDFSGSPLAWKHFEFCFVAQNNPTNIKFMGNGHGTPLTPGWANTGGSFSGLGYGFTGVIGLDNVSLTSSSPSYTFEMLASDTCAPALLTYGTNTHGTANWFFNGNPLASGVDTIIGTQPGHYTVQFITECDTITRDTTLINCDTCDLKVKAQYFCARDLVHFDLAPPCIDTNCIGEFHIEYGDGQKDDVPNGAIHLTHMYPGPGTYTAVYCWWNHCTGQQICDTLVINIVPCPECDVKPDFDYDECIPVHFINKTTSSWQILSMFWDFGDATSSSATNPVHAYASPGTYYVCLTVVTSGPNGKTCKQTVCKWITVRYCDNKGGDGGSEGKITGVRPNGGEYDKEIMNSMNIQVFPNPTKENVSITGLGFDDSKVTISLYDITGRLLHQETVTDSRKEITFSTKDFEPGTYILKVKGESYTRDIKLIKE